MSVKYSSPIGMLIIHNGRKSDLKFLIGWSPKAGCTIICKIFFEYMDELEKALQYSPWIHDYRQKYYYEKYGRVKSSHIFSNNYTKIKFVRNPYSRAVSSYIHVMKTPLIKTFNNQDMSFYSFLLNIKNNTYSSNSHYNLQITKIELSNVCNTLFRIIKIENLEKEINSLNKQFNLKLNCDFTSDHHINKLNNININAGYVRFSQFKENIPNYKNFYDKKIQDLVYEIYKPDIVKYNYTFKEFLESNI